MSSNTLAGKAVLVTGAARRLGAAIARGLHGAGMRIALHYHRSEADARALRDELEAARPGSVSLHRCDLLDGAALPRLVEEAAHAHGGLHVLVNNASTFYPTAVGETTEAHWADLVGTNLKAPFFLSQAAAPWLRESQGCIVNMADIYGARALGGHPVYSAAKAGLIMLTESLAAELAPHVRVNAVAPGPILQPAGAAAEPGERGEGAAPRATPLERWGEADEIARAVLFLVRDASFTTGATLPVDGGRRVASY